MQYFVSVKDFSGIALNLTLAISSSDFGAANGHLDGLPAVQSSFMHLEARSSSSST